MGTLLPSGRSSEKGLLEPLPGSMDSLAIDWTSPLPYVESASSALEKLKVCLLQQTCKPYSMCALCMHLVSLVPLGLFSGLVRVLISVINPSGLWASTQGRGWGSGTPLWE